MADNRRGDFSKSRPFSSFTNIDEEPSSSPTIDAIEEATQQRQLAEEAQFEAEVIEAEEMEQEEELNRQEQVRQRQAQFRAQEENEQRFNEEQSRQPSKPNAKSDKQKGFSDKEKKLDAEKNPTKNTLDWGWFSVALLLAVTCDLLCFVISFIVGPGQLIASFVIMPIGIGSIWLIHFMGGIKFDRKILARFGGTAFVEFIPFFNMLPFMTGLVIVNKVMPKLEEAANKTAHTVGGEEGEKAGMIAQKSGAAGQL